MSGARLVDLVLEQRVTAEDVRSAISATVHIVDPLNSVIWVTSDYLDGGATQHGPFSIIGTVNVGDTVFMARDQEEGWWILGGVVPPGGTGEIDGGRPDSVYGGTMLIDGGGV